MILDTITKIITLDTITKIITIVGFCLAFFQLRNVIKNTKVNVLKTEFDIFGKISEKEKIFVDCYEQSMLSSEESKTQEYYSLYKKSKEQYLSELNLVCLYILEGYFTRKHFFQEYGSKMFSMYDEIKDKDYTSI
ncbi:hypothetical protein PZA47_001577, partial [Campylobacter jejuni]|nr:hypothetical protein [Campylobacter jejuni]